MPAHRYRVTEIFGSIQGEGAFAGAPATFVRLAGCNLKCSRASGYSFDCDTTFQTMARMTAKQINEEAIKHKTATGILVLTGGEPLLQVERALLEHLRGDWRRIHLETNGTIAMFPVARSLVDWISVSPKLVGGEYRGLAITEANEVKVVVKHGDLPAYPPIGSQYRYWQPAWNKDARYTRRNVEWATRLAAEDPRGFRLGFQLQHLMGFR